MGQPFPVIRCQHGEPSGSCAVCDRDHSLSGEDFRARAAHPYPPAHDSVNHPKHYTDHPSGVECITITEHMGFSLGNAIKYIWRADLKHDAVEDLQKARWYLDREIAKRTNR